MKFKRGDLVEALVTEKNIVEGKIYEVLIDSQAGVVQVLDGAGRSYCLTLDEVKPAPKTLDNLEVGDELVDKSENVITVLGVCGLVILMSGINDSKTYGGGYLKEEVEAMGWKLKPAQQEPKEMTVAEVAEALGHEVKIIKEK